MEKQFSTSFPSRSEFLADYNISEDEFESSGLKWDDLSEIFKNYSATIERFSETATVVSNIIMNGKKVHSVRKRVKDPLHLIEKIIRKTTKNEKHEILYDIENYTEKIHDLVGIRALHLFKEDWKVIAKYIDKHWKVVEKICYIREGDDVDISQFKEMGIEVKIHPFGYRSIHYIIVTNVTKEATFAEIQIRTIFEEGWSEIDHLIRYPYFVDNHLYANNLKILNRIAGISDEMGTFIQELKKSLEEKEQALTEKDAIIEQLSKKIESLKVDENTKKAIRADISAIKSKDLDFLWGKLIK